MTDVSFADQLKELDRELAMRRRVYPRLVSSGKMTKSEADWHMTIMLAVRETVDQARAARKADLEATLTRAREERLALAKSE